MDSSELKTDNCRANIVLLDDVLQSRYNVHKCYVGTLNMVRAFDSMQHSALEAVN